MGGFATTGPAGGRAAMAGTCCGGATTFGACRGCGTIILFAGAFVGAGLASAAACTVAATVAPAAGAAGFAAGAAALAGALTTCRGGATTGEALRTGTTGTVSCCRLSKIAFAASPGFDTRDQSIRGFASASCRVLAPPPLRPFRICVRTRSASSVSIELECVFFSVTPTAVRASRIALLFTSSSRANSLIRTVLIRPRVVSTSHSSLVLHADNSCLWG
jgi:hypothetical protein